MKIDQLFAFHRIFGSCVLGPPQKNFFFAVPRRGSFGGILTMQLEPPKPVWAGAICLGCLGWVDLPGLSGLIRQFFLLSWIMAVTVAGAVVG